MGAVFFYSTRDPIVTVAKFEPLRILVCDRNTLDRNHPTDHGARLAEFTQVVFAISIILPVTFLYAPDRSNV